MKITFTLFILFYASQAQAQSNNFTVKNIPLPEELAYYDNQFSGLYIQNNTLYLLSESRLQDAREAKIYSLSITDLNTKMADSNFMLPYKKIAIKNLDKLSNRMYELGNDYEGLEAIVIKGNEVYFTVETATPSPQCFLIKGTLVDSVIEIDLKVLIPLPKPNTKENKHIYNAGFEGMAIVNDELLAFFEYNNFADKNIVVSLTPTTYRDVFIKLPTIQKLPFRLTDITQTGKNTFTAINYFYKGDGEDEVYRVPKTDKANDKLIRDGFGYKSYTRLVKLTYKKNKFIWEPLWQLPFEYMSYNWEGIAAHNNGYFILNDKYTPARPYKSTLLYLQPIP